MHNRRITLTAPAVLCAVLCAAFTLAARVEARPPTRQPQTPPTSQAAQAPAQQAPAPASPPPSATPPTPQVTPEPAAAVAAPTSPAEAAQPASPPPASAITFTQPDDPRLAQVFAVFDANCAQCHQSGKLTTPAPAGALGNILDLRTLANQPQLIRRGEPDASLLYQVLLDRHRPLDLAGDPKWPNADEIARVRTWIAELPQTTPACPASEPVTDDAIAAAIDDATAAAGELAARELRFITLTHLANACATPAEIDGYRQAVSKVLNSLSWGTRPIAPVTIDAAKSILAFKLSDLGWVDEHWAMLARAEPKAIAADLTGKLKSPVANARPIRGDWFAYAALRPPFYAELLGLPPTLDETARLLGITRQTATADGRGMRAGLRTSQITRGPRVIERHQADTRRLWIAHDFADGTGERDIFEHPLGGIRTAPDKFQFRADGLRAMFALPNGFLAYGLYETDGHRIDQQAQRLELDLARAPAPTIAAQSCLSCHTEGIKPFTEQMRAHLTSEKFTAPRDIRDQALALYDTQNEWTRVVDEDAFRFRRALIQAGIDPDLTIQGLEPSAALAARYLRDTDLAGVAAEAGLTAAALEAKLSTLVIPDRTLIYRLRQGVLSRPDVNRLLLALDGATPSPVSEPVPSGPNSTIALSLWTDRTTYKPGELMTVYAQPTAPCYLTLISVAASGKATVLFPSEFDPDNLVRPDAPFALPSDKAQYQFRLKDPGTETIVARCQTLAKLPAGVEPDYERQRFTVLGSYDNFLRTSYGLDAEAARQRTAARPAKAPAPKDAPKPEAIARAAVSIVIK